MEVVSKVLRKCYSRPLVEVCPRGPASYRALAAGAVLRRTSGPASLRLQIMVRPAETVVSFMGARPEAHTHPAEIHMSDVWITP
jgi:hypothetical protein